MGMVPTTAYWKNAQTISQRQIALGGYRLGDIISTVAPNAPASTTPSTPEVRRESLGAASLPAGCRAFSLAISACLHNECFDFPCVSASYGSLRITVGCTCERRAVLVAAVWLLPSGCCHLIRASGWLVPCASCLVPACCSVCGDVCATQAHNGKYNVAILGLGGLVFHPPDCRCGFCASGPKSSMGRLHCGQQPWTPAGPTFRPTTFSAGHALIACVPLFPCRSMQPHGPSLSRGAQHRCTQKNHSFFYAL